MITKKRDTNLMGKERAKKQNKTKTERQDEV